jgi:hypothetical protein
MPIKARRLIKKMRGGAQAHLLEAEDGNYYVTKFLNNPQHRRILVNELLCCEFLRYLEITSAEWEFVELTAEFIAENPEVCIQLGNRSVPPVPGWHFGSRFPGDPASLAVYDILPDKVLADVTNLYEFPGMLVFDKWVSNADSRQAVFFRARLRDWRGQAAHHRKMGYLAMMIDHGYAFSGPHWDFTESAPLGLYIRPMVYNGIRSLEDFQPWLDRVRSFPESVVDKAWRQVPPEWLEGDEQALEQMLERLLLRRQRVGDLLEDTQGSRTAPFANWREE